MKMKRTISIPVPEYETHIDGILQVPDKPSGLLVLAHGAGAGMDHPFMENLAAALYSKGIGTLRFQFIYMQEGSKRPDRPAKAHAAWTAALLAGKEHSDKLGCILFAGGKSFGGRMLSQLAASAEIPATGLVLLASPCMQLGNLEHREPTTSRKFPNQCFSSREPATPWPRKP